MRKKKWLSTFIALLFVLLFVWSSTNYFSVTKIATCNITGEYNAKAAPAICQHLYLDAIIFGVWIAGGALLLLGIVWWAVKRLRK